MCENIAIPRAALEQAVEFLESLDASRISNIFGYLDVLHELKVVKQKLEIKELHAGIMEEGGADPRLNPRIGRLWHLGRLDEDGYCGDDTDF